MLLQCSYAGDAGDPKTKVPWGSQLGGANQPSEPSADCDKHRRSSSHVEMVDERKSLVQRFIGGICRGVCSQKHLLLL